MASDDEIGFMDSDDDEAESDDDGVDAGDGEGGGDERRDARTRAASQKARDVKLCLSTLAVVHLAIIGSRKAAPNYRRLRTVLDWAFKVPQSRRDFGTSLREQGLLMPSTGHVVPGGHGVHSAASRSSQFLDQRPWGQPVHMTPTSGEVGSPLARKVPGGQIVALELASFAHCDPGGQR